MQFKPMLFFLLAMTSNNNTVVVLHHVICHRMGWVFWASPLPEDLGWGGVQAALFCSPETDSHPPWLSRDSRYVLPPLCCCKPAEPEWAYVTGSANLVPGNSPYLLTMSMRWFFSELCPHRTLQSFLLLLFFAPPNSSPISTSLGVPDMPSGIGIISLSEFCGNYVLCSF